MFVDSFTRQRMCYIRSYLTERLQDEAAFRKMWMRNNEVLFVNDPVAVKQKIQINGAWSLMNRPDPPERIIFNLKHSTQQSAGVKACCESQHRVVKGVLSYRADR